MEKHRWIRARRFASAASLVGAAFVISSSSACVMHEHTSQEPTEGEMSAKDPPPDQADPPGDPPSAAYTWAKGHWIQHHGNWAWTPGHWQANRTGYAWEDGYWAKRPGGWVWVNGRWRTV